MKSFLTFLFLIPVAFAFCFAPMASVLWDHVNLALFVSQSDPWAMETWWNWYGSWIFFGGPLGRWLWGAAIGFRLLKQQDGASRIVYLGELIERPHLRVFAVVLPAGIMSLFAFVGDF
jgi:hypothetical protein